MSYTVTTPDIRSVEDQLVGQWQKNLASIKSHHHRFRWYYLDNPVGRGVAFVLEYRAPDDHQPSSVVGSAGVSQRRFFLRGKPVMAALLGDLNVDLDHRTMMPAIMLQRATRTHAEQTFAFVYGFSNRRSAPVQRRAGYRRLGDRKRYACPLRYETFVDAAIPNRVLSRAVAAALTGAARVVDLVRSAPVLATHRLEWLADVDQRFDRLWQRCHHRYPIIGYRGADFLRWRFVEKPGETFEFVTLTRRASGELEAYAVLERDPRHEMIILRDLFGEDETRIHKLLSLLIPALRRRGHRSVSVSFLGARRLVDVLARHWFAAREDRPNPVLVGPGGQLGDDRAALMESENWYLMDVDEDE